MKSTDVKIKEASPMHKYLDYLRRLEYPEYAEQENGNGKLSLTLLDLSMDDGQRIDEKIFEIIREGRATASKYSFSQNPELIKLIADYVGVDKRQVLVTAGSDGGLRVVSQALVEQGMKVCIPLPSFGRFEYHAKVNQGDITFIEPQKFPYDIDFAEVAELCRCKKIDVLYLANPNNPTGIYKANDKIEWLLENYDGYLILDEALADYANGTAAGLLDKYDRLIIVRSFSKLFGLAGMRVGYVLGDEKLIRAIRMLVSPFETSSLAVLLAVEMLKNSDTIVKNKRDDLKRSLSLVWNYRSTTLGFSPTQSSTFVMYADVVDDLYELLLDNGIKTVPGESFRGLEKENTVRVSLKSYLLAKEFFQTVSAIEVLQ